jgi:hypothetical protein
MMDRRGIRSRLADWIETNRLHRFLFSFPLSTIVFCLVHLAFVHALGWKTDWFLPIVLGLTQSATWTFHPPVGFKKTR